MKMDIETVASELKLDRSRWSLTTFGEVAVQQKESVDRENTDITRYVKGEHMYSEDLHLREWGELKDEYLGPAFIRKFEEGDILYGSRRTYLRKVCIAPFEGITSNTTFVIKANEELIDKNLLPFVMLSEGFSEHSIRNSKGSVNPYVNWKDLASYEFLIPPKEQQEQMAELLWTMDGVVQENFRVREKLDAIKQVIFEDFLKEHKEGNFKSCTIEDIAALDKYSCVGGPFGSDLTGKDYVDEPGVPVLRGANLTIGKERFVDEGFVYVSEEKAKSLERNSAYRNDIVVTQRGTLGQVGIIPIDSKYEKYIVSQSQMKLTVNETKALPEYVYQYLLSAKAQKDLEATTICTGIPHINLGIFKKFPIWLPSISFQRKIIEEISKIDGVLADCNNKLLKSLMLKKSLLNQVF